MSWKNLATTYKDLADSLNAFDWKRASAINEAVITQIRRERDPMPQIPAKGILGMLRRKRRLDMVAQVAEALLRSGQRAPQIQRQYAQALIDLGYLSPAECILNSLIQEAKGTAEEHEGRGLIGRIYKQNYVNSKNSKSPRNRSHLERAVSEYLYAYRLQPTDNLWHGINVVALAERARRDGYRLGGLPDPKVLAREIAGVLSKREKNTLGGLSTWDLATAMEAHLALADTKRTLELALAYTESPGADAFEVNSTLRQMVEVWQLTESKLPGSRLLPILRAALAGKQGSSLTVESRQANADLKLDVRAGLEKVFGAARFRTLKWYQLGLERAKSIARIERPSGQGHGTGWIVKSEDFFPEQKGKLLVITNHHVISDPPYPGALRPDQAKVHFQMLNLVLEVEGIIWSSPPGEYDATFVSLKDPPGAAQPLDLFSQPVQMADPAPRLHIIGHPGGRDVEFSLDDSQLLAAREKLLHYRTPTEGGSSGSPVFEDEEWKVVALHHAGRSDMTRIDGKKGTYDANEGISIHAIRAATAKAGLHCKL
jgi:hypothetical protein